MQTNNGAVDLEQSGNNIVISGNLDELVAFESSGGAGTHKWIGLDVGTNLDSIVGATWNGYAMTQADVDEASSVDLGAGHIVF